MLMVEEAQKRYEELLAKRVGEKFNKPNAIGAAVRDFLEKNQGDTEVEKIDIYHILKNLTLREIFGFEYEKDEILEEKSDTGKVEEVKRRFRQIDAAFTAGTLTYEDVVEILGPVPVEYMYKAYRSTKQRKNESRN